MSTSYNATLPLLFLLELIHLLSSVAQLLQRAGQLALVLDADLGAGDGLHETRRAADKDLDVLLLGLGEHSLEELLADVAAVAGPGLRGLVQDVEGTEALRVRVLELGELLLEQDVLLGDVAEDEGDLGLVVGVAEDVAGDLVHGGDARAAGDEGDVVVLVLGHGVLGEGPLNVEALAGFHVVQVGAHGAVRVLLDKQIHIALRVCEK